MVRRTLRGPIGSLVVAIAAGIGCARLAAGRVLLPGNEADVFGVVAGIAAAS